MAKSTKRREYIGFVQLGAGAMARVSEIAAVEPFGTGDGERPIRSRVILKNGHAVYSFYTCTTINDRLNDAMLGEHRLALMAMRGGR